MSKLFVAVACLALAVSVSPLGAAGKPVLPEKYARWLNQEVVYVISDEERKAFLGLASDEARDSFINEFWEIRNPLRGSSRNPFKEEHYRRLEYANEHFGRETATPGWKTDMGRTYILFGPPQSRAPYKGYGQIYPLELWFYSNSTGNPSLPPFFYVLFFVPEDIGDYRFYHPVMDGPMKLVRGSNFQANRDVYNFLKPLAGDLARSVFSLIPSEPIDTETYNPNMTGEMLVSKIQNFANDSFQVKKIRELRYLRARVNSWFLVADQQPLGITAVVLTDPTGRDWLDYGLLIDDPRYGRTDPSGTKLIVSAGYRLLTEKGDLVLEDAEERAYPAFEGTGSEKRFQPFVLANRLAIVPGRYKLEVQIANREAGRSFKAERTISVEPPGGTSIAGPLLTASFRKATRPDANLPFQYFGIQFLPDVDRRFSPRDKLLALFQLNVPPGPADNYQVEYVVAQVQDRNLRKTFADSLAAADFRNGVLLKSKTIPLEGLEAGDYRVVFNLKKGDSPQVLASSVASFRVGPGAPERGLYFLSNFQAAATSGVASYMRALESLSQNRKDEAAGYLREALERTPSNTFAFQSLVDLYFTSRKFSEITQLYGRMGMTALNTAPETLAQLALSFWATGNPDNARRVLTVAQGRYPNNPLLDSTARRITAGPAKKEALP